MEEGPLQFHNRESCMKHFQDGGEVPTVCVIFAVGMELELCN